MVVCLVARAPFRGVRGKEEAADFGRFSDAQFECGIFGCEGVRLGFWGPPQNRASYFVFGAFCLAVRTLTFCQLMGVPLNH